MRTILIGLSIIIIAYCVPDLQYRVYGWSIPYALGAFMVGWGIEGVIRGYKEWKNSGDRLD